MTDKEKLEAIIAEIDKRVEKYGYSSEYSSGKATAYREMRSFINSLPEEPVNNSDWLEELRDKLDNATPEQLEELWNKYPINDEEEPVSEDLEKAAEEYAKAKHQNEALIDIVSMDFKAGAQWQKNHIWHDVSETPAYIESDKYVNTILVFGETSVGVGCSVANMIDEDTVFAPINVKEYKWGKCPFTKWAYLKDITPNEE